MSHSSGSWSEILPQTLPEPWAKRLGPDTLQDVRDIGKGLDGLASTQQILPSPRQVFRALHTPPEKVRVLLVGQDPYPHHAHAMGLAFSVPESVWPLPGSARNIRRELADDLGITLPHHGSLLSWVRQGVLLLNRHLTTAEGSPAAHHSLGWDRVTNRIIEVLRDTHPRWVAILWGREAQSLTPLLGSIPRIESAHPSPLSASRGFFGSRPFSRANDALRSLGQDPVDWRLDEATGCTPG